MTAARDDKPGPVADLEGGQPEPASGPRIVITENGPYRVSGRVKLTVRRIVRSPMGESVDWEPPEGTDDDLAPADTYKLCRCGRSQTKPFCDGSHKREGFDGTLVADRAPRAGRARTYVGQGLVMTDDRPLCVHAEFCADRIRSVWGMVQEPDDPEVRGDLQRRIALCPSGRLAWAWEEGGEAVEPSLEPSIAVVPNGPLWVRGGIPIEAPDRFVYEVANRVTLCRCGHSRNKPFCDGSHAQVGFRAEDVARPPE